MAHNIVSLIQDRFDTRIAIEMTLININGETVDCIVFKEDEGGTSPTYTVKHKETKKELCTFRPYHLTDGPFMYLIVEASRGRGDATLIVPDSLGLLSQKDEAESDDEEPKYNVYQTLYGSENT